MLIYIVWLHKVIYAHFYCKAREASPETCSKVPLFAVHVFLSPGSLTAHSLIVDRANLNITFTFMHLADAFIQSDLQLHSGYTFLLVHVFPGNRTHNLSLSWRNVLPLSHTGTL